MALFRLGRDSDNITIFAGKYSSFRDRLVLSGVDRLMPISGLLVSSSNTPEVAGFYVPVYIGIGLLRLK